MCASVPKLLPFIGTPVTVDHSTPPRPPLNEPHLRSAYFQVQSQSEVLEAKTSTLELSERLARSPVTRSRSRKDPATAPWPEGGRGKQRGQALDATGLINAVRPTSQRRDGASSASVVGVTPPGPSGPPGSHSGRLAFTKLLCCRRNAGPALQGTDTAVGWAGAARCPRLGGWQRRTPRPAEGEAAPAALGPAPRVGSCSLGPKRPGPEDRS